MTTEAWIRYALLGLLVVAVLYIIGTSPGSLAAVPMPVADPVLEGDFNLNNRLDFADIVGLFNYLGGDAAYLPHMDMNHNGRLDFGDVVRIWGAM